MKKFTAGLPRKWTYAIAVPWVVSMIAVRGTSLGGAGLVAFLAFSIAMGVVMLWPTTFHLGDDGVYLQWLFFRRFVPFSALEGVNVESGAGGERRFRLRQRMGSDIVLVSRRWGDESSFTEAATTI